MQATMPMTNSTDRVETVTSDQRHQLPRQWRVGHSVALSSSFHYSLTLSGAAQGIEHTAFDCVLSCLGGRPIYG